MKVTIFDASGRSRWITGRFLFSELPQGWVVEEGEFTSDYYHDGTAPVLRPDNPSTLDKTNIQSNSTDTATISNIPSPADVFINGKRYEVTDGVLEFTTDTPGSYRIRVQSFPYLDKEFTVNAS